MHRSLIAVVVLFASLALAAPADAGTLLAYQAEGKACVSNDGGVLVDPLLLCEGDLPPAHDKDELKACAEAAEVEQLELEPIRCPDDRVEVPTIPVHDDDEDPYHPAPDTYEAIQTDLRANLRLTRIVLLVSLLSVGLAGVGAFRGKR